MPANTTPIFGLTPVIAQAHLIVAGNATGSNNSALLTGGAFGTRVSRIRAVTDDTAGSLAIRFFLDIAGTLRIWKTFAVPPNVTLQAGQFGESQVANQEGYMELNYRPLNLPSGVILRVNALSIVGVFIDVTAEGMDY